MGKFAEPETTLIPSYGSYKVPHKYKTGKSQKVVLVNIHRGVSASLDREWRAAARREARLKKEGRVQGEKGKQEKARRLRHDRAN